MTSYRPPSPQMGDIKLSVTDSNTNQKVVILETRIDARDGKMAEEKPIENEEYHLANLRLDYEKTTDYIKLLTEIRFKLLAFTPVASGISLAAITIFSKGENIEFLLPVGILGLMATIGIIIYDLRNTELYDAAIKRAGDIEDCLNRRCESNKLVVNGGLFKNRPPSHIPIWHDLGLSIVYSAAIIGWVFIILDTIIKNNRFAIIHSIVVGIVFILIYLYFAYYQKRINDTTQPSSFMGEINRNPSNTDIIDHRNGQTSLAPLHDGPEDGDPQKSQM